MARPAATRSRTVWQSGVDVLGPVGRQGGSAVAEGPAGRGIGPRRHVAQCGRSELGSRRGGIVTDILAGEDALDGLLDGPDRRDHAIVEGARPGVGQQDLGFECQPVQGVSHPAIEDLGAAMLLLELVQCADQLGHLGGGDRLAPAQAREERPVVVAAMPTCLARTSIAGGSLMVRTVGFEVTIGTVPAGGSTPNCSGSGLLSACSNGVTAGSGSASGNVSCSSG